MSDGADRRRRAAGHVWVDGRLLPAGATHLSAFDRGFQLGDGHLRDAAGARRSQPTELAQHIARLRRSGGGLEIPLPDDVAERLAAGIAALLAADGLDGPAATPRSASRSRAGVFRGAASCHRTRPSRRRS